ncbi:hypothetical protein [Actinomadura roseirufa]|uniref:hypothetical protein n=1 Tax=Actinomadura roseirufa TaxID=2094049 RepID=UPI001041A2B1|nr:hypothetical protein [Actinomadura roseirufa]
MILHRSAAAAGGFALALCLSLAGPAVTASGHAARPGGIQGSGHASRHAAVAGGIEGSGHAALAGGIQGTGHAARHTVLAGGIEGTGHAARHTPVPAASRARATREGVRRPAAGRHR